MTRTKIPSYTPPHPLCTPHLIKSLLIASEREPPDAMSLRYADTSLPALLGRPSLRYAEMSMRNTSKCACVIQEVFKLVFKVWIFFQIFRHSGMRSFSKMRRIYQLS